MRSIQMRNFAIKSSPFELKKLKLCFFKLDYAIDLLLDHILHSCSFKSFHLLEGSWKDSCIKREGKMQKICRTHGYLPLCSHRFRDFWCLGTQNKRIPDWTWKASHRIHLWQEVQVLPVPKIGNVHSERKCFIRPFFLSPTQKAGRDLPALNNLCTLVIKMYRENKC